jgi:hypothetical protein
MFAITGNWLFVIGYDFLFRKIPIAEIFPIGARSLSTRLLI